MDKKIGEKYPILLKGKGGSWHAYGNGWAVCAPTKESVQQKYEEFLNFMNELIDRPLPKTSDTLRS
jgi:hypothetical protein